MRARRARQGSGELIAQRRLELGMTQLELAKAAKTTVRVVSALEQGVVQSIKLGVAIRMARVLSGSSMNACASVVAWLLRLDDGAQPAKGVRR